MQMYLQQSDGQCHQRLESSLLITTPIFSLNEKMGVVVGGID